MTARFAARSKRPVDEDVIVTEPALRYTDDCIDAPEVSVDPEEDFISSLPTETLHNVLSHLIMDHDPERGIKIDAEQGKSYGFKEQPHVLLTISKMSKYFHAVVESLSLHHLTKNKEKYRFTTTAEVPKERRRSPRLAAKPQPQQDPRKYRVELVKLLHTRCVVCNCYCTRRAPMSTGVACCARCEDIIFPDTINLTTALNTYDLRDYMLIKARTPGPHAKHTQLPAITYGTLRSGMGWGLGMCVSYRFFKHDVAMIVALVHEDVNAQVEKKRVERIEHKHGKLRKVHIELKVRFHKMRLATAEKEKDKEFHQKRLSEFQDPAWDGDWKGPVSRRRSRYGRHEEYGRYSDIHMRICAVDPCYLCQEEKDMKYNPYW
ncbi:hypothetical protein LTR85_009820 [Meristemomyces frigidus]|nr:hypothetical protein LTR85_009820 [Meristemomyces frigidus]